MESGNAAEATFPLHETKDRIVVKRKKLGEILIENGLLTEEQLKEALAAKERSNLKLGQVLTRSSLVNESQLVDLLSQQLKVRKYDPNEYPLDMDMGKIIPMNIAEKYQVAPLKKKGNLLTIAMIDPMDIDALDAIEIAANMEVEPVICTEQELNQLISSIYGSYSGMDNVLESIEKVQYAGAGEDEAETGAEDVQVSSLHDMAEEAPVIRLVNSILSQAIREGASDIHISPEKENVHVRFRVDGKLHEVPAPPKSMFLPVASRIKLLSNMDIAMTRVPQDGRFTVRMNNKEINIRASALPTIHGENIVLRLLDMSAGIYSLEQLGMSPEDRTKLEKMIVKPYGMILSTGPTGSGKSTSLYAILNQINKPDINIITLEDPVEFRVEKIRQVQLNRKAGMTFASGLRSILRQDPDVIMVGEIRDSETATIAVQAALTGHRVLSTVHTNDAAGAISRFIDMGIEPFLVSSVMLVIFAQRLLRRVCPHCRESYQPPERVLKEWGLLNAEGANFQRGRGCFQCMGTGYKGRTGVFEVLVVDDMIRDMILARKSSHEITRAAREAGKLTTLKENAGQKVAQGITSLEEAASAIMS